MAGGKILIGGGIVCQDFHAEGTGPDRHFLADAPEAENTNFLAHDLVADRFFPAGLPISRGNFIGILLDLLG